jgi:hypothetical protein
MSKCKSCGTEGSVLRSVEKGYLSSCIGLCRSCALKEKRRVEDGYRRRNEDAMQEVKGKLKSFWGMVKDEWNS